MLEHLKNVFLPLSEMHCVLAPGGLLVVSVPNLAALHNRILLSTGRQPTCAAIEGAHVRGYAIRSMEAFLLRGGHFELVERVCHGLHPLTSRRLRGPLAALCHTPVWALRKRESSEPTWRQARAATPTTTTF